MGYSKFYSPIMALLAGAFIISFSSVFVKISDVPSTVSAFYRVFFGSVFLIAACGLQREFKPRTVKNHLLAVLCGVFFALDLWAWHISIQYIGPGLATILANFQVFVLTIAGYLLYKEKVSLLFILAVPLAFVGLFLVIGLDMPSLDRNSLVGIGCGFATACFYSVFLLIMRKLQAGESDFSLFYYLMVVSIAASICLGIKVGVSGESFYIPNLKTWAALIALGLLCQTLAWGAISNALPKVKASVAGLVLLLQPALSFVWDVSLFGRKTGALGWFGVLLVLSAIYLGTLKSREE